MANHPSSGAGCAEDTRIDSLKQVAPAAGPSDSVLAPGIRWILHALLACVLWLVLAAPTRAEGPGTASVTVLPADGQTRGVQLRAQTVDAVIREDAGGVWADTRIWINFFNGGQSPIVVPVTLPGPQIAAAPLPERLQVTLNKVPLELTRLPERADDPQITATATVTVPARGTAALTITYRQELPVQDGLATFAYLLTATTAWSGRPESLRVSVHFDPPAAPGQILGYTPVEYRRERDGLTWHWENTKATQNIGMAFMAPSWWTDLEVARQLAGAGDSLAEHALLAGRYWQLATLAPPAFLDEDYFGRFFPSAVEALRTGVTTPGGATSAADVAAARVRLAGFYGVMAQHLGPDAAAPYLQLAASELSAALALSPGDAAARQAADAVHRQLLALARDRGDTLAAQEHEARLAALATEAGLPSDDALARANALTLAEQAVASGDLVAAAGWVAAAFGAEAVPAPGAPPPRITQSIVDVTTSPAGRAFQVRAIGGGDAGVALMAQASQALGGLVEIELSQDRLAFSLPYTDTPSMLAAQAAIARTLAELPELALLAAALSPAGHDWRIEAQPFVVMERYVDKIDLRAARATWDAGAERAAAAAAVAGAAEGADLAARLSRVQASLWTGDSAAWYDLAERSRATYRVELNTRGVVREWELAAGEVRELRAEAAQRRYDRLGWLTGGTALLLLAMVYAVWRAGGRGQLG